MFIQKSILPAFMKRAEKPWRTLLSIWQPLAMSLVVSHAHGQVVPAWINGTTYLVERGAAFSRSDFSPCFEPLQGNPKIGPAHLYLSFDGSDAYSGEMIDPMKLRVRMGTRIETKHGRIFKWSLGTVMNGDYRMIAGCDNRAVVSLREIADGKKIFKLILINLIDNSTSVLMEIPEADFKKSISAAIIGKDIFLFANTGTAYKLGMASNTLQVVAEKFMAGSMDGSIDKVVVNGKDIPTPPRMLKPFFVDKGILYIPFTIMQKHVWSVDELWKLFNEAPYEIQQDLLKRSGTWPPKGNESTDEVFAAVKFDPENASIQPVPGKLFKSILHETKYTGQATLNKDYKFMLPDGEGVLSILDQCPGDKAPKPPSRRAPTK